jgi:hypothetical protein
MLDEELDPIAYKGIPPGTRVKVYDWIDKVVADATTVRHYGKPIEKYSNDFALGPYESCVDVIFDHKPDKISKGHFTYAIHIFVDGWFDADFVAKYNKRFIKG